MNLNPMILTNILSSPYFKVQLYELKTYHEVVDEIFFKVSGRENEAKPALGCVCMRWLICRGIPYFVLLLTLANPGPLRPVVPGLPPTHPVTRLEIWVPAIPDHTTKYSLKMKFFFSHCEISRRELAVLGHAV